jgi:WD40 repeat protein
VLSLAFAPDGKTVVAGGQDWTIRRLDAATAGELATLKESGPVLSVAVSPDGSHILAGIQLGVVKLWDTATGKPDATLVNTHGQAGLAAATWDPRGGRLAVGTADGLVRLWDANRREERNPLPLPSDQPACLAVTPDGQALLTGGQFDGQVWPP